MLRTNSGEDPASCESGDSSTMPPCCGSGCAVCVLDYWDGDCHKAPDQKKTEFDEGLVSNDLAEMLDAFESAEHEVQKLISEISG